MGRVAPGGLLSDDCWLLQHASSRLRKVRFMSEIQFDNVDSILTCFKDLKDPRSHINRRHLFGDLLVICIMAVIAGADGPEAIGTWAENNHEWLKKHLELPSGVPSHDTLGRLLAALKPVLFQSCFHTWIAAVAPVDESKDTNQIAIDGKVLRRSHDRSKALGPLWLVSAWAVDRTMTLGQLATDEKSNEITAIPQLLDNIEIKGAVVTIDAAGCQRDIAKKIIDGGADYVLSLKGNQGTLHNAVRDYIIKHMENDFADILARHCVETIEAHGRVDEINYFQMPVPDDLVQLERWAGLNTIGVASLFAKFGVGLEFHIESQTVVHDWVIQHPGHETGQDTGFRWTALR